MPGFPCETNWEVPVSNYLTANEICLVTYLRLDLHQLQTKRKQHALFLSGLDSVEPAAGPAIASHKCLPPTLFGKQFLKNMIRKRWKNQTVLRNTPRFSIFRVLLLGWSRLERPPFCRMLGIHAWVLKQTCQKESSQASWRPCKAGVAIRMSGFSPCISSFNTAVKDALGTNFSDSGTWTG